MSLTIGVDIGGTKVLGGVVGPDGSVSATARRATPASDTVATLASIVDVIQELRTGREIEAIGIGAAGWIDADRSTVLFAPNLAWRDEKLRDEIAAQVDLPIVVENDANVAAWAEFRFGAARDADDSMVLFTIGTGIGGGIILGGQLVRGAHGVAAELGHVTVVPDGQLCGCGRRGCIEQYASGSALVRFARASAATDPASAAVLLDLAAGDPGAIVGPMVTEAAQKGDPTALSAFHQVGYWLGTAYANMVQTLDPQVMIIGGGVAEAGDLLLEPTRLAYRTALARRAASPAADIRLAEMGNIAGVVGAGDLARR